MNNKFKVGDFVEGLFNSPSTIGRIVKVAKSNKWTSETTYKVIWSGTVIICSSKSLRLLTLTESEAMLWMLENN